MVMGPLHWNLNRPQLVLSGKVQQLGIEAPPFYPLAGKDYLDRLPGKSLKSALSVAVVKPEKDAQSQIEKSSVQLAIEGLTLGLQVTLEPARPDGHVCPVRQRREQLIGFG